MRRAKPSKSGKFLSFHGPTWSPNGKRIAFVCNSFSRHEICSMDKAGRKIKYLTHCDCAYAEPDWSTVPSCRRLTSTCLTSFCPRSADFRARSAKACWAVPVV